MLKKYDGVATANQHKLTLQNSTYKADNYLLAILRVQSITQQITTLKVAYGAYTHQYTHHQQILSALIYC